MPRRKQEPEKNEGTPVAPSGQQPEATPQSETTPPEAKPKRRKTVKESPPQETTGNAANTAVEETANAVARPKKTYRRKKIEESGVPAAASSTAMPATEESKSPTVENTEPAVTHEVVAPTSPVSADSKAGHAETTCAETQANVREEKVATPPLPSPKQENQISPASLQQSAEPATPDIAKPVVQAMPPAETVSAASQPVVTTSPTPQQPSPAGSDNTPLPSGRPYGDRPPRPYTPGQKTFQQEQRPSTPGEKKFTPGQKPFRPGSRPFKPGQKPGGKPFFKGKPGMKHHPKRNLPAAVKELLEQYGLAVTAAFKVSRGAMTLEQALAEKKIKDERAQKAQTICQQYPRINFALACLLLKENKTPEDYFAHKKVHAQQRIEKEKQKKETMSHDEGQSPAFTALEAYRQDKVVLDLAMYDGKTRQGILLDFTPYEFYFLPKGEERSIRIHRLELKYFCSEQESPSLKKMMMIDKAIQGKKLLPTFGREGRYKFAENMLKAGNEIMVALHEGEIMRGLILWSTPYDILLQVGKQRVWIFCHAVTDCALARKATVK
jgi:sRNA-binding regulator protein Hfq